MVETERAVERKVPRAVVYYRQALRSAKLRVLRNPSPEEVEAHQGIIAHQADVPIVVAAIKAETDFLVTFNRKHFIDDPGVAVRSGLRIGTPGDALALTALRLLASRAAGRFGTFARLQMRGD